MDFCIETLDAAILEIGRLKSILNKGKTVIVENRTEKDVIKATSYAWIKRHKAELASVMGKSVQIDNINDLFVRLLTGADKRTKRKIYLSIISELKKLLVKVRNDFISGSLVAGTVKESVEKPNFSELVANPEMLGIMERRWGEIEKCIKGDASLAAVIMMGGLLEALFLAKINTLDDKKQLFNLKSTPVDSKTGKAKPLSDWMLKDFIDTLCEAKMIRDFSATFSRNIRDYRNFVHPEKELRIGISINIDDANLCWLVTQEITKQLLSVK